MKTKVNICLRVGGRKILSTNPKSFYMRTLASGSELFLKYKDFPKVYLKVSYGKKKNVFGKTVEFYNDWEGNDKRELLKAYRAFIEEV